MPYGSAPTPAPRAAPGTREVAQGLEEVWQGRGILGVRAMKLVEERGSLVGAMVCDAEDQLFAIASNGIVIRTRVVEIRPSGRDTMGVTLMNLDEGDTIVAVARGEESDDEIDDVDEVEETDVVAEQAPAGDDGEAAE